jgi:subtilisin family serine protease
VQKKGGAIVNGRFARVVVVGLLMVVSVTGAVAPSGAVAGSDERSTAKIEAGLLDALARGEADRFVVELAARADLAAASRAGDRRGQATYDVLVRTARSSQVGVLAEAARAGAPARSFWIVNEVVVISPDPALAERMAVRPEVSRVRAVRVDHIVEPVDRQPADEALAKALDSAAAAGTPVWGVDKIGADEAWSEGITGSGIVVAGIDTGVDYTHPALVDRYRGNLGGGAFDHNYNWWDPTGICGDTPCDNLYHGTHTVGTMVGGDGPGPFTADIGVAPGAQWIAAKGCEGSSCTEEDLVSSGQWVLAPTDLAGLNPDPAKRPDVVNNSWSGPGGDPFFLPMVEAWRAAGIIPVFSAGNVGPHCNTARSPGDYLEVIAAGATDENDLIAVFSSRGPSAFGKIHPDVSAPGVAIASAMPGGGYNAVSGTSMAAPTTAGAIALVLSANEALRGDFDAVYDAVTTTAVDRPDGQCGGGAHFDPNNVYGEGRIDAQAAAEAVAAGGWLAGTLTDASTGTPVVGAHLVFTREGRTFPVTTDDRGAYILRLAAGTYAAGVMSFDYAAADVGEATVTTGETTAFDASLERLKHRRVTGHVVAAESGLPVEGARVVAIGTPAGTVTRADGAYALALPAGTYTLQATWGGCTTPSTVEVVVAGEVTDLDIDISPKLDGFGHACRPIAEQWVTARHEVTLTDGVAELDLPFAFPYYGETHTTAWATVAGYLTFGEPRIVNVGSAPIPSPLPPNSAIYPMWQSMGLDDQSAIAYDVRGHAPDRVFVVEYRDLFTIYSDRVNFEVQLHEDGTIDMLYGPEQASPGLGYYAVVGIEGPRGLDALQFSAMQPVIEANTAFRYEVVPTGLLGGRVGDANSHIALPGATVTADPGGYRAVVDSDGNYKLRLRPGDYDIRFEAPGYVTDVEAMTVSAGTSVWHNVALTAPVGGVDTSNLDAALHFGSTTTQTVSLSNVGSAPLEFEVSDAEDGVTHPTLPPALRAALSPGDLPIVIDDPDGDTLGTIDVATVRGQSTATELTVAVEYTPDTPIDTINGWVMFDTDRDAATGLDPEFLGGSPDHDIGVDYAANFAFFLPGSDVHVINADFEDVAAVPPVFDGQTVSFTVPLAVLGQDDGEIDVALQMGGGVVEDFAPDTGHGTVEHQREAPWLDVTPASGTLDVGEVQPLTVSIGATDLEPGTYEGHIAIAINSPTTPELDVDVTLKVGLPDDFGEVAGTLIDAHGGAGVPGTVTIHSEWRGTPVDASVVAGSDGSYDVLAPAGTWPIDVTADGYEAQSATITVPAGLRTTFDAQLQRAQPHAVLHGGPISVALAAGEQTTVRLTLGNVQGRAPLDFKVTEHDAARADVPWLSAVPESGEVAAGESADLAVTIDASTLAAGEYSASFGVVTNDPDHRMFVVPVEVSVTP